MKMANVLWIIAALVIGAYVAVKVPAVNALVQKVP